MSTIDQQFVEFIVKSLVGNPDSVVIERTIDEKGVLLELSVDQEDLGRVIGKRGATAQSIRTLLRALGTKNEARYNLKIVDPEGGNGPSKPAPRDDDKSSKDEPTEDADDADEEDAIEAEAESEAMEEITEEESDSSDDDDDSMVARHRRDLEDLDDDDL